MNLIQPQTNSRRAFWFGLMLVCWLTLEIAHAQGITAVTRRTVMSPAPGLTAAPAPAGAAAPNANGVQGQNVVAARPAPVLVVVQLPRPPAAETAAKVLAFQQQRAQAGSAQAQYDLGMRYLTGDGVEKNVIEARKWLTLAVAQKHAFATKKLAETEPLIGAASP